MVKYKTKLFDPKFVRYTGRDGGGEQKMRGRENEKKKTKRISLVDNIDAYSNFTKVPQILLLHNYI